MGPKKQKGRAVGDPKKSNTGATRSGNKAARVQLTSENEVRLRRLLQNTAVPSSAVNLNAHENLSELQKKQATKRLRSIYDSLASEGFSSSQIELALGALPPGETTMEAVLDWLCFNLPGNELPLKFSSGVDMTTTEGGSVQLLAAARPDWVPSTNPIREAEKDQSCRNVLMSRQEKEDSEKDDHADWIRRYMAQEEEEENNSDNYLSGSDCDADWEIWADSSERQRRKNVRSVVDPSIRSVSVVSEFQAAKQAALEAKKKGDKQKQVLAGKLIRDLKQEMALLGLSEDAIKATSDSHDSRGFPNIEENDSSLSERGDCGDTAHDEIRIPEEPQNIPPKEMANNVGPVLETKDGEAMLQEEEDILGLFDENAMKQGSLPESIKEMQKREKAATWAVGGNTSGNKQKASNKKLSMKNTQEDVQRQPKAVLQQQCQKVGWEVPKYEKLSGRANMYSYSVTIMRHASGRGKNKIIGGPVTYNFPGQAAGFSSIEEAQNVVATWALFSLFHELPLYHILLEPYRSMCLNWHAEGVETQKDTENEKVRRETFVQSLVNTNVWQDENHAMSNTVDLKETSGTTIGYQNTPENLEMEDRQEERIRSHKEAESRSLLYNFEERKRRKEYKMMLELRAALPMATIKDELLKQIQNNDVVVVSGETGCGKTTQVPQYILEEMIAAKRGGFCNIICTQPRRIAAVSVAERVAAEQCQPAPGAAGSLVGYQVRLDNAWNLGTRLLFCTTGILLRRLAGDRDLMDVSHIIIDEVHERSVLGDFTLIILKDLLLRRRASLNSPLKVILMSATVDAQMFSDYFGHCPVTSVKGRNFPVKTMHLEDIYESLDYRLASDSRSAVVKSHKSFSKKKLSQGSVNSSRGRRNLVQYGWGDEDMLEEDYCNPHYDESLYCDYSERTRKSLAMLDEDVIDYDLLEDLIKHIDETGESGAILVFLPGMAEIQLLLDRLVVSQHFHGVASEWLLPLHSSIGITEQRKAFQNAPSGLRKIVLATNIAETSITIDDVVYVIDCGKHKEIRYDPRRKMSSMVEAWISQANAKQRLGRAGRVKSGHCFRLYTRHRFEKLMRPFQVPEILRVPLMELCLQIKFLSLGNVASFLEKGMEPPKPEAVKSAVSMLFEVGALDEKEELTALGFHLAKLPVEVRIGKMMLYGAIFNCLSPVLTVAACLSYKSPFYTPHDQKEAAQRAKNSLVADRGNTGSSQNIAQGQQSDHLAMVAAYNNWTRILKQQGARAAREYCKSNFLSGPTLSMIRDMRMQFATLLADIGFINLSEVDASKRDIDQQVNDLQKPYNCNAQFASIVKATLCAGLYPNVAAMDEESIRAGHASALSRHAGLASGNRVRWLDGQREVFIHPSSVNHNVADFHQPFLVFHEKVETSKVYLRDTTIVSPYTLLLFGGTITIQHQTGLVSVDGWLKMNAPAQTAVLFKELRIALDSMLQELINNPQGPVSASAKEIVPSIAQLLTDEEKPQM